MNGRSLRLFCTTLLTLSACATGSPIQPVCGDGAVEGEEECDDGNIRQGDGCSGFCRLEDLREVEDLGTSVSTDRTDGRDLASDSPGTTDPSSDSPADGLVLDTTPPATDLDSTPDPPPGGGRHPRRGWRRP